ncbi:golgin subfamily A member 2-like [Perognathus longimembris pacificus]|uniref:golgin subfamily A member 2-like n=1 Tax=Perognathus longimembris pacificus TaxID=214514 RepID=UPI0020195177|nr:golgin subfamily A member 2-like [Perognathus longimembris pacificus]
MSALGGSRDPGQETAPRAELEKQPHEQSLQQQLKNQEKGKEMDVATALPSAVGQTKEVYCAPDSGQTLGIPHLSLANGMPVLGPRPHALLPSSSGIPSVGLHHYWQLKEEVAVAEWAGRSEPTRHSETAAGEKLPQEQQQQQNCPALKGLAKFKKRKKTPKGGEPKANTPGDGPSTEDTAQDRADPEPPVPLHAVGAASVRSVPSPENTGDLQRRYQHLVLALVSSKLKNQQLCTEIQHLQQEKEHLQQEQAKENGKRAHAQDALQTQLVEVHKRWIQRLRSEKCTLQSALARMQQVAEESHTEREGLSSRLHAAQQHIGELQLALSAVTTQQLDAEKQNLQLTQDLRHVTLQLQEKSRSCEDAQAMTTDLQKQREVLWAQKLHMQTRIHKLQRALEERAVLRRQGANLRGLVKTLQAERDQIAQDLRRERAVWEEMAQQQAEELNQLREEREQALNQLREEREEWEWQVLELQANQEELTEQLAALQAPAGPRQAAHQLQAQASQMQEELKNLEQPLHGQEQASQSPRLQNLEQQEQLCRLEKKGEERPKMDEPPTCTPGHDEELKAQLAQLQDLRATCDRHTAANQQLSSEKEALQQQVLRQTQLGLEQLSQEPVDSKLLAQMEREESQGTRKRPEATGQRKEQAQAQHGSPGFPGEGEGVSTGKENGEEASPLHMSVPEDGENPQVLRELHRQALSAAEPTKTKLSQQPQEQQARCRGLANLVAQCQTKPEPRALFPTRRSHGLCAKRRQDTQVPKRKLQICVIPDLPDRADSQNQAGDLQGPCSRLTQHITAMQEAIAAWEDQMETLAQLHREKEEHVHQLCEEKEKEEEEEALRELLLRLAGEGLDSST